MNQQALDSSVGTAPYYNMRQGDGVGLPKIYTFTDAYRLVSHPVLTSKMKETVF
jgi:hypothetical protein